VRQNQYELLYEIRKGKLADGSLAVGFFNRTEDTVKVDYAWRNLGFQFAPKVRDLWLRKNLDKAKHFTAEIPAHGCVLLKVR
jgi:alpha-galactosidase